MAKKTKKKATKRSTKKVAAKSVICHQKINKKNFGAQKSQSKKNG